MRLLAVTTLVLATLLAATAAGATTIKYELTSLGGNDYRYDWTVYNNPLTVDIMDFVIYFSDVTVPEATDIANAASPVDWDVLVMPPSGGPTGLAGYYDALALGPGIAPGSSLGGFAATFKWTGVGEPGSQYFEIYDEMFNLVDSGYTVPMGGGQIPEWGSLGLFLVGIGPIGLVIRRRR